MSTKNRAHERTFDGLTVVSAARAALWLRVSKLQWLTSDEAALYMRVSARTFGEMVGPLQIPIYRPTGPNGSRRYLREDLDKALLSTRESAA